MAASPKPPQILFRADGNSRIGLGHLTRCRALAELLTRAGLTCALATREPLKTRWFGLVLDDGQRRRTVGAGIMRVPPGLPVAAEPAWLLQQGSPVLVLDGYDFGTDYQRRCGQPGRALVVFDDFARTYTCADVVLNAAADPVSARYTGLVGPGTHLCLGPAFALLRDSFWQVQRRTKHPPDTDRLFLCLGGADPHNHTLPLMRELAARFPTKHLSVVTGAAYAHQPALAAAAAALPNVRLHHNLGAAALAALLRRCGVLVCPPSGMAYECAAVGGLLLLVQTADNQRLVYDYLVGSNLALPYAALDGLAPADWPAAAAALRQRQRAALDGPATALRYERVFEELLATYALNVRRATAADALTYFDWANDPTVRATAVQPAPIAWATHVAWFERRLADPESYLYLFAQDGCLIGQVRVQFGGGTGAIGYSLDPAWRGQGLGLRMLRRALAELRRERPGAWALAGTIRTDNRASVRVFGRLGFAEVGQEVLEGVVFGHHRLEVAAVPTFAG